MLQGLSIIQPFGGYPGKNVLPPTVRSWFDKLTMSGLHRPVRITERPCQMLGGSLFGDVPADMMAGRQIFRAMANGAVACYDFVIVIFSDLDE